MASESNLVVSETAPHGQLWATIVNKRNKIGIEKIVLVQNHSKLKAIIQSRHFFNYWQLWLLRLPNVAPCQNRLRNFLRI